MTTMTVNGTEIEVRDDEFPAPMRGRGGKYDDLINLEIGQWVEFPANEEGEANRIRAGVHGIKKRYETVEFSTVITETGVAVKRTS